MKKFKGDYKEIELLRVIMLTYILQFLIKL